MNLIVALVILAALDAATGAVQSKNSRDATEQTAVSRDIGQSLLAIVSLRDQRVTIYDSEGPILRAPVSSGKPGYDTPAGIYSVIQKEAEHYSNLYDDASMPFMQRITWSGIALHAGALPGYAASHGCVRMPHGFAERLFGLTKLGMRVVISRDDIAPSEIIHSQLFQPSSSPDESTGGITPVTTLPVTSPMGRIEALKAAIEKAKADADVATQKAEAAKVTAQRLTFEAARSARGSAWAQPAKLRAETQLKAAERALETIRSPDMKLRAEEAKSKALARIAEAQAQIDQGPALARQKADEAAQATEAARIADEKRVELLLAARKLSRRMAPISVFINRQSQHLYVRQSFEPVFDTPITVRDPEQPIGTHVYTAVGYRVDAAPVRWNALTLRGAADRSGTTTSGRVRQLDLTAVDHSGEAKAALDRIEMPQEVRDRISDVVAPGSSLIISDEELSKETSKGTDFVVLLSGEPQGGIKIRRRNPDGYRKRDTYSGPFFWW
jgi:hypothetical protein